MEKAEVRQAITEWNNGIQYFMEKKLPELLVERGINVKDGKVCLNDWFQAQYIIQEQHFYDRARVLQQKFRAMGYDVKMDMQDHTLVLY